MKLIANNYKTKNLSKKHLQISLRKKICVKSRINRKKTDLILMKIKNYQKVTVHEIHLTFEAKSMISNGDK